jgi:hypothetical protein
MSREKRLKAVHQMTAPQFDALFKTEDDCWSILKHGVVSTSYKINKEYLHRYVTELKFQYNHRNDDDIIGEVIK